MEDIAGEDYMHAKRVSKYLEIKSLGDHHDLYLKSDTLILADAFEKSLKKVLKNLSFRSCNTFFQFQN